MDAKNGKKNATKKTAARGKARDKAAARMGRETANAQRIIVKVDENPPRSESARKLFDLYAKFKTVGEFKELAKKIHRSFLAYHTKNLQQAKRSEMMPRTGL